MTTELQRNVHLDRKRLFRLAEAEEGCGSVAVGGLASELGIIDASQVEPLPVFGRLVELLRRDRGWTREQLSDKADVALRQLVLIEEDEDYQPEPRAVYKLAEIFGLPATGLSELSGLAERRDGELGEAALRFAARSESMAKLSKAERQALEELVKVLHGTAE